MFGCSSALGLVCIFVYWCTYSHTLAEYSSMVSEICNCECPPVIPALCAVIPQHTYVEHYLNLCMHCHILRVSHKSDVNITCYLHSITLKKSIVYVHREQEKHLLPHSFIPTKLSFHISDFSCSFTQWVKRLYYHFPIVVRPRSTCWEMITWYANANHFISHSLHLFHLV